MSLRARFRLRRGAFELDAALELPSAGVSSLFGPSGSGKTTLLRCLAGLERPEDGHLQLDGETWVDTAAGLFVPPWRRAIGFVPQEAGLFPHLDVRGNLSYGLRRVPRAARRLGLDEVVGWLELAALLERRTATLSGGERQRVAIGRALLTSPRLLLLDEPVSALDERARGPVLAHLERLAARVAIPIVYVSHSVREVARLCDTLAWISGGRVRATGPVAELLASPELALAEAEDASAVLAGTVLGHDPAYALTEVAVPGGRLLLRRSEAAVGTAVRVAVAARDVSLALDPEPRSSILNVLPARVVSLHDDGPGQTTVRLSVGDGTAAAPLLARITRRSADALGLAPGTPVYARVKSVSLLE